MFPDPTLQWRPFPSILDGMKPPPTVLDRGFLGGALNMIVLECSPGSRAYRIEVRCEIYSAFEEMIYSIVGHGDGIGRYNGGVYIKEAQSSRLLEAYMKNDPIKRKVRHFLFVGSDFCYETLGVGEPTIHAFSSKEEAEAWGLVGQSQELR